MNNKRTKKFRKQYQIKNKDLPKNIQYLSTVILTISQNIKTCH